MRQIVIFSLALLLLPACNTSSVLELIYFNRIKYSFPDEENEKQRIYMCEKGVSKEDSYKRALKAHQFMLDALQRLTQEYITTPSFKDKSGDTLYADALKKLEDGGEKLATDIEEQFQCVFIGEQIND